MFELQIKELREYILHLDEKIQRYRKTGRDPVRLKDDKAKALETIEQLKQAKTSNTIPLHPKRWPLRSNPQEAV